MGDIWVFGYGSLMWRPDFNHVEKTRATLFGLHRSLCVYSWVHRGTKDEPGLVFGLDKGGACQGIAYRVAEAEVDEVLAYLRERELPTNVYMERWRNVRLTDGRNVRALTYVVDRTHEQYAARLSHERMLELVRHSVGKSGPNIEYVTSTVEQLLAQGVRDHSMETLYRELKNSTT